MSDLDRAIVERHSIRKFLPLPGPREVVDEALALAQHVPSNSNIQPWRLATEQQQCADPTTRSSF